MAVTATQVKELRERTGAGMMECKKALSATDGDMDAAIEQLRKSGLAQADKKASRVAAEGKIAMAVSADGKKGVMVEVNCETDFVAKDASFNAFADGVARNALDLASESVEELLKTHSGGSSIEEARQALIVKIGENIQVRRVLRKATSGILGSYSHGGKIGVLVDLAAGDANLAKDLAMHIAALNPQFVSESEVPEQTIAKEREILLARAEQENSAAQAEGKGKPADIIEKKVAGQLRKHLAEITLLGQAFVKDGDVTVAKLLQQQNARVAGFSRLVVGEGIEKRESNFADEVMQQVKGA